MSTTRLNGHCSVCELEVELVKGRCRPHPQKDRPARSQALCDGGGIRPLDVAPEADGETYQAPTLEQALLEASRPPGAWAGAVAQTLDPQLLDPDPNNPRGELAGIRELADSILAQGILQPIVVTLGSLHGRYTIVAGHRRHAAALLAGLREVPVLVRQDLIASSNLTLTAQVVENYHRLDLTPLEEARVFAHLRDLGMKQTEIADTIGCNQAHVSRRLALLKLPEDVARTVGTPGGLDIAAAVELTKAPERVQTQVFQDLNQGADPARALRTRTAANEAAEALEKLEAEFEAAGVALVDFPPQWHWGSDREDRPLGTDPVGNPQRYGGTRTLDTPDCTYEHHFHEPCHGAAISPHREVIYVCLDPTRHGYPSRQDELNQAQEAARTQAEAAEAERAVITAQYAARTQAARTAALAKIPRAELAQQVITWRLLETANTAGPAPDELIGLLLEWFDLDPSGDGDSPEDIANLVAAEGDLRIAYASTVAAGDRLVFDSLQSGWLQKLTAGHPMVRHHLDLIEVHGYHLVDADRELYSPAPPPVIPSADEDMPDRSEAPEGTVAWWSPLEEDRVAGDEPRWVDQAEADALDDVASDRLVWLHHLDGTDEGNASQATAGDPGPQDPVSA